MRIHVIINAVLVLKHLHPKKKFGSFLRLLQVKYGNLTFLKRLLDSTVVGACISRLPCTSSICCDYGGMVQRLGKFAVIIFLPFNSEPCIQVVVRAAMPPYEIANPPAKTKLLIALNLNFFTMEVF